MKSIIIIIMTLICSMAHALTSEESCQLSISEQVTNIGKLKKTQNNLIDEMQLSNWIPKELISEVKRTNEESFIGVENILIRRNNIANKKQWTTCNEPLYRYSAYETYILNELAISNIKAIEITNKYSNNLKTESKCSSQNQCDRVLFNYFRDRQIEYSKRYLEEINIAKQKALDEINRTKPKNKS